MPSAYSVRDVSPGLSRCESRTWVRKCMRVESNQQKNGVFARRTLHEIDGGCRRFVIDGLHSLSGERARVLDRMLADLAPTRLLGRNALVPGLAPRQPARTNGLL